MPGHSLYLQARSFPRDLEPWLRSETFHLCFQNAGLLRLARLVCVNENVQLLPGSGAQPRVCIAVTWCGQGSGAG